MLEHASRRRIALICGLGVFGAASIWFVMHNLSKKKRLNTGTAFPTASSTQAEVTKEGENDKEEPIRSRVRPPAENGRNGRIFPCPRYDCFPPIILQTVSAKEPGDHVGGDHDEKKAISSAVRSPVADFSDGVVDAELNLKSQGLGNKEARDAIQQIHRNGHVKSLNLAENPGITVPLEEWATLVNLEKLDLSDTRISGDIRVLQTLAQLVELDLAETKVSGDIQALPCTKMSFNV